MPFCSEAPRGPSPPANTRLATVLFLTRMFTEAEKGYRRKRDLEKHIKCLLTSRKRPTRRNDRRDVQKHLETLYTYGTYPPQIISAP
jgi:hypothetical protein